jgi:hypothetical protein
MPGRMAVPGIGQRLRPEDQPKTIMEEMATLIYQDAAGRSLLDPNTLKDMPAWAVSLMNQNRLMSIELATFYTLLVRPRADHAARDLRLPPRDHGRARQVLPEDGRATRPAGTGETQRAPARRRRTTEPHRMSQTCPSCGVTIEATLWKDQVVAETGMPFWARYEISRALCPGCNAQLRRTTRAN